MDQDAIEAGADGFQELGLAIGARPVDQDVADRAEDLRPRRRRLCAVEQRDQLEAQRAAAEGKHLDHQRVGPCLVVKRQETVAAPRAPGVVDRPAMLVQQHLEGLVGRARRWQLHQARGTDVETRDRHAAGGDDDIHAGGRKAAREQGGAAEMADAEQVLDVDEDAAHGTSGRLRRSRVSVWPSHL